MIVLVCPRCGAKVTLEQRPGHLVCGVVVDLDTLELRDAHVPLEVDDATARRFSLLEIE